MPLPALGELPQLTALSLAWRRLIDVKPVLMVVNNTSLVCCWDQSGRFAAGLAEDPHTAGRRAPDPHPPDDSPGNSVAAVTQPDRPLVP